MKRREFLKAATASLGAGLLGPDAVATAPPRSKAKPPNILWISAEDISPDLGCYGDAYAVTPAIDAFAAQGVRFDHAYAHMGVCAPARSGIITGMYPTSIGTNHMRCKGVPPPQVRCFTEHLREAGYMCTNRSKTDYQFNSPVTAWDLSGRKAHWRARAEGQPFFSVVNLGTTHEGQVRSPRRRKQIEASLSATERHDPREAVLPPYYPDTPLVRQDWAQYYDLLTLMDREVAGILKQLEDDGLVDDTIVWFWGDHGRGLPRGKRWIYDSGLRVPLVIRVPEKLRRLAWLENGDARRGGEVDEELVSFVDFAPTVLSLAGVPVPPHMEGGAFLGPQRAEPRQYVFAARDRVDEAYDMIRAVRDRRFKYIRNFMPHLPRSLDIDYMNQMPTMKEMRRLDGEGKLRGAERQYFESSKPVEELYDTRSDPHEVRNLAEEPGHRGVVERMRAELFAWMRRTGDFGLIPEPEFDAVKRPGDRVETTTAPGVSAAVRQGTTRVTLACTTPGASIAYRTSGGKGGTAASGAFLSAMKATMHGRGAKRAGGRVHGWRDRKTWFSWEVDLARAGTVPVHVYQAYARNEAGRKYTLSVGDQQLTATVQRTEGWQDFRFVKVGEVTIPEPGTYVVCIKPAPGATPYSMDLRFVVLDGGGLENYAPAGPWRLYSGPLVLRAGQKLSAKACRLGFNDSRTVEYAHGSADVPAEPWPPRPHWRDVVSGDDLIERLLAVKALDGAGQEAMRHYERVLSGPGRDPSGSVRYWAVLGLRTGAYGSADPVDKEKLKPLMRQLLADTSAVVRIAAAHALCDWGDEEMGLPVLAQELKGELGSARLHAITALEQIGEKARPATAAIQAATKDKLGYVGRVSKRVLGRLSEG